MLTPEADMTVEIGNINYTVEQVHQAIEVLKKMQQDSAEFNKKERIVVYRDKYNQKKNLLKCFAEL